jgi:hypothetical protein
MLHSMNRLAYALALGLTSGGLLFASALPAAAAPGGPCSFASDDVVSQALGSPTHAVQGIELPDLQTCAVIDPSGGSPLSMFKIDSSSDSLTDAGLPGSDVSTPPTPVQVDPVDGIGDSAAYLHLAIDDKTMLSLRVQVGTIVYAFNAPDTADAPAKLMTLGKAVLGQ